MGRGRLVAAWVTANSGPPCWANQVLPGPHGLWLCRPRSSPGALEPGSRTRGGGQRPRPGAQGEALTLPGRQGAWAEAKGLRVIHRVPPAPSSAHVGLWAQELPSQGHGTGLGAAPWGLALLLPLGEEPSCWPTCGLGQPSSLGSIVHVPGCTRMCTWALTTLGEPALLPVCACEQHLLSRGLG